MIEVKNQQTLLSIPQALIKRTVQKILCHEDVFEAVLSIVFVTDSKIQSLNKKFLGRAYATDVLAFDLSSQVWSRSARNRKKIRKIEGEIVISTRAAVRNAKAFGTSPRGELMLYVVHGILHLLGYDDHLPKDTKRMRAKEKELMKLL